MLNDDATEYDTDSEAVEDQQFLISTLETDKFVNYLHYGQNDDRKSGTEGIVAVVISASTSGVDANNVATYSLEIKVTYGGTGTVSYYTALDGNMGTFATKNGSTYYPVVTSELGEDLSAKVWVFVDGTTEAAHTTSSSLAVEYRVVQNA